MAENKTYYFIGINGIGMSGLAEILKSKGHHVLGSDTSKSIRRAHFESIGIKVSSSQVSSNITSKEWIIVLSSAIKSNNKELIQAIKLGCKILKRGELLAEIIHDYKKTIAVVGTHGKTTTSSLLVEIFTELTTPSYFVGGHFDDKPHARANDSEWFITELDESDGSFLNVTASNTIITNIEHDHVDFYQTKDQLLKAFSECINKTIQSNGCCAINLDDPISEKLYKKFEHKENFVTFGIESNTAQIRAESIEYHWNGCEFTLVINDNKVDQVVMSLFGKHNVYNALSAISNAIQKEEPLKHILNGLKKFSGVKRRLELKYQANGIKLYDDYAHHPTEVISTLEGLFKSFTNHRIITIFQPHRYTRLTNLFDAFSNSFNRSSKTCIVPVFAAGETPENKKSSFDLANQIKINGGQAESFESFDDVIDNVSKSIQANDIIIVMGAGNISNISKQLIPLIKRVR
ncbi:MAG: UDP-N-acetylmuramate--L-alanine ligase [Candidatus Margulisiibacteriota bacterium]